MSPAEQARFALTLGVHEFGGWLLPLTREWVTTAVKVRNQTAVGRWAWGPGGE